MSPAAATTTMETTTTDSALHDGALYLPVAKGEGRVRTTASVAGEITIVVVAAAAAAAAAAAV